MLNWLWPIKTAKTMFDVWSIAHLAFWIVAGTIFAPLKVSMPKAMGIMMVFAYGWEVFERYAEKKWPHMWLHQESWINSLVSDPLMGVLGIMIGYWIFRSQ